MTDAQKAEREEASRAAFEALSGWQAEHLHRSRTATGRYFRYDVQSEWEAWQAGANWAASPSAAEVAALRAAASAIAARKRPDPCHGDSNAGKWVTITPLKSEMQALDAALAATQPKEPTA